MPKQSLTATFVQGVKSTPGKRVEYSDTKVSGLVLRVTESGAKSWSLRYRRADQSQQRYTIGAYPAVSVADARDRAIVVLSGIASGTDPTDDKKAKLQAAIAESLSTFAAIGVQYFDDAAKGRHRPNARPKRQSTLKMERDYFDRLIEPVLGRLAIGSFGRQDIQRFISDIGDKKSPTAARQCRNILRQIYSYATYLELVIRFPVD